MHSFDPTFSKCHYDLEDRTRTLRWPQPTARVVGGSSRLPRVWPCLPGLSLDVDVVSEPDHIPVLRGEGNTERRLVPSEANLQGLQEKPVRLQPRRRVFFPDSSSKLCVRKVL